MNLSREVRLLQFPCLRSLTLCRLHASQEILDRYEQVLAFLQSKHLDFPIDLMRAERVSSQNGAVRCTLDPPPD